MNEETRDISAEQESTAEEEYNGPDWVALARDAYDQSKSFTEISHINRWRRNYSLAQSEHPDDSKYHTTSYAKRSKFFRGKTESAIRKNEAALSVALFSNPDVLTLTSTNLGNPANDDVIEALSILANHHLDNDIKWFLLSVGAYHEAMICGDVISEQCWDYERLEDGTVETDIPAIKLYPLENVKISPNSDWTDPIKSSPYVIVEIPMFIGDIKERPDFIEYEDSQLRGAINKAFDRSQVQSARQGQDKTTPEDARTPQYTDFDIVFVHKNTIRHEGEDWFYYTLSTELLLSDPAPLSQQYPHLKRGERPFVWGTATIEPHKVYRRSLVDRTAQSQAKSNDIDNLRFDNVKQVLNKRKYVQRYMGVDYAALKTSVPGGVVMMDDINAVRPEDTIDVTGSSYQEQHVVNADFDELAGSFSMSSVSTNRALNETVGGMQLLSGNSNVLTEYQLRVFVETWVEPVLRQVVQMIQFYEDDSVIQQVTGKNLTNADIRVPVKTRVSVGFGATDPMMKVQKLILGIDAQMKIPGAIERLNVDEISKELWAALGYHDGGKFILPGEDAEDPRIAQMMQVIQQLQQVIQTKQIEGQASLQLEMQRGKNRLTETVVKTTNDRQVALTIAALDRGMKLKELETKSGVDSGKLNLDYLKEINRRMDVANQQKELNYKIQTGNEGI